MDGDGIVAPLAHHIGALPYLPHPYGSLENAWLLFGVANPEAK